MRLLFGALLALALGVGVILLAQQDPGYISLHYRGWLVETSLSVFLLVLLVGFVLFYIALRLLWRLWDLPASLLRLYRRYRRTRAQKLSNTGLIALAEGNWRRAEKRLSRAAADSDTPLINYLGAARAAQKQQAEGRRDRYLAQAYRSMPEAKLAIGLTQADLQLSQGQLEQALASLRELSRIAPRHVYVLYLLKKLYEKLQSWDDLAQLLPALRRHHVLEGEALTQFEQQLYQRLLESAQDITTLHARWQDTPKAWRQHAEVLHHYISRLFALGEQAEAEGELQPFLKKHFDAPLVRLYGQLQGGDATARLHLLEQWLKSHPQHPELLLAAARQSLQSELWGKARSYLEASLGMDERRETRRELAELMIKLGEQEQALALYRELSA